MHRLRAEGSAMTVPTWLLLLFLLGCAAVAVHAVYDTARWWLTERRHRHDTS